MLRADAPPRPAPHSMKRAAASRLLGIGRTANTRSMTPLRCSASCSRSVRSPYSCPPPGEHVPAVPDSPLADVAGPGHPPEFNLDNPLAYMSPGLRTMSEQHLTGSGETVLRPFEPPGGGPSYIGVAEQRKASYFDLGDAWYSFTPTEQLAANQHVLDIAIANRDTVRLSVPFDEIKPTTFTAAEIRYLESHGYQRVDDFTFVPPNLGGRR
jgi:hypothetical protein